MKCGKHRAHTNEMNSSKGDVRYAIKKTFTP